MKTTNHTPKPWTIPFSHDLVGIERADGTRQLIAQTHGENFEANARLISAAPELLAALENILAANPDLAEVCDEARAAIAKAKL